MQSSRGYSCEEDDIALARAGPGGQMFVVGLVYSPEMTKGQWRICVQIQTLVRTLFLFIAQFTEFFVGYFAFFVLETVFYHDLRN